jgi:hypothetical protein
MADTGGVPMRDLLPASFGQMDAQLKKEIGANRDLAREHMPNLAVEVLGDKVSGALEQVLNVDVFELMANAWAKASELHEYKDPPKSDEIATLFLDKHPLSSEMHPIVEVRIGRFTKWTLTFTLALEAEIQLVELTLHKGRITQIGKCDCQVSASLKYKDTPLHELMAPRTVPLTRSFKLPGDGLPLL